MKYLIKDVAKLAKEFGKEKRSRGKIAKCVARGARRAVGGAWRGAVGDSFLYKIYKFYKIFKFYKIYKRRVAFSERAIRPAGQPHSSLLMWIPRGACSSLKALMRRDSWISTSCMK